MATVRCGYKVAENLHVGGGVLYAGTFFNIGFGVAAAYGNVTIGNENSNASVAFGYGGVKERTSYYYSNSYDWSATHGPLFTFCAMHRVGNRFALVTENWFFPVRIAHYTTNYTYPYTYVPPTYTYEYEAALSFGFRIMWEKNSFDLAIATETQMIGSDFPAFPYLDYVFKF
jgi:hypothetical protein